MNVVTNKHGQRGVALILVLIIVALMTIIATQLVSERNLHARRTSNILLAENAWSFAEGAEKLASIAIVKSLKNQDTVNLSQAWATEEVVFPIDGGSISAKLKDLSSCFNLNGVLANPVTDAESNAEAAPDTNKQLAGEIIFQELISDLQLNDVNPRAIAATLRDWVDDDLQPSGFEGKEDYEYEGRAMPYRTGNTLLGSRTEIAAISGYSADLVEQILPYVCVIPNVTDLVLNINTIADDQPELLSSVYENLDVNAAATILSGRPNKGFDKNNFNSELPADAKLRKGAQIAFTSQYFSVFTQVALGRTRVNLQSILEYKADSNDIIILARLGLTE